MKLTIRQLKEIVRKSVKGGSSPEESYSKELFDDPKFNEKSVYVPDDIKKKLKHWAKSMKLSSD